MKRIFLIHRLWGLSFGLYFGTAFVEKPLWLSIIIITPVMYFLLFGDSHFRKD